MTSEESGFLTAIKASPKDSTARRAYADWLEEQNRPYEAALQRGQAGLSDVYFKVRRKSDGLFSDGNPSGRGQALKWSAVGKTWKRALDVRAHMLNLRDKGTYYGTPWDDIEVVMQEVRVVFTATLPVEASQSPFGPWVSDIVIKAPTTEPEGDR